MTMPERILNKYSELTESQRIELGKRSDSYHANPQQGRSWDDIKQEFWRRYEIGGNIGK